MAGAFPGCDLLIAKTFANDAGYYRDMADGIVWATDNGAGLAGLLAAQNRFAPKIRSRMENTNTTVMGASMPNVP